jgi:sec-independent protein translocase protein TatA
MGSFSIVHWGIVLAIVILVFGTSKLKNLGSDLGGAIKGFKEGLRDDPVPEAAPAKDEEGRVRLLTDGTARDASATAGLDAARMDSEPRAR